LVKWHDELSEFGLVVLAPHRQQAEPGEVKAVARTLGVNYTVTTGHVAGGGGGSIPHCFVFDAEGKCVHDGGPDGVDAKLRAALGTALVAKAGRDDFTKVVAPHAEALKAGRPPAGVLAKLLPLTRHADAATAAQAKALAEALTEPARTALAAARAQKADDPVAAHDRVQRLSTTFRNTPLGTDAARLLAELKADKVVAAELRARPFLDKVKALDAALAKLLGERDAKDPAFQKAAAAYLKQLRNLVVQLQRTYPNARATQEAVGLAEKFGVTLK
jgi:hypothetical protein